MLWMLAALRCDSLPRSSAVHYTRRPDQFEGGACFCGSQLKVATSLLLNFDNGKTARAGDVEALFSAKGPLAGA